MIDDKIMIDAGAGDENAPDTASEELTEKELKKREKRAANQIIYSKKEEWIQINPVMYEFVCKHKVIIEKLNYYEWARFLERVNEETVAVKLLNKIDESTKRNNLAIY